MESGIARDDFEGSLNGEALIDGAGGPQQTLLLAVMHVSSIFPVGDALKGALKSVVGERVMQKYKLGKYDA